MLLVIYNNWKHEIDTIDSNMPIFSQVQDRDPLNSTPQNYAAASTAILRTLADLKMLRTI